MANSEEAVTNGHTAEDHIKEIITAATEHDTQSLEQCIDRYSFPESKAVDVQDPATGFTPLHAVIASSKLEVDEELAGSYPNEESGSRVLRLLLENGAIWNQLDKNNETPGCVAHRLGLFGLYQIMVDAGVRAELLLSRLEEYEELDGEDDSEEEGAGAHPTRANTQPLQEDRPLPSTDQEAASNSYLSSALALSTNKLLDEQQNGVMMAWESGIMLQSANALLIQPGLKVLNIGYGMGIIDTHIQNNPNKPASHHIVEAHPDVLREMQTNGWLEKPNVVVHGGKWQQILPQLAAEGETFDAIYFDTFAESYSVFRDFFCEHVISLLDQSGRWSFFNGMGADRQISYDVYQKVVELDLFESGFDVEWVDVELPDLEKEWEGVRRKYWSIDHYRLPICRFMD